MTTRSTDAADVVMSEDDALVVLRGDFDQTNHEELRSALLDARAGANLTVDLGKVTFIDWTGIALILSAANDVRERGGRAVLANSSPSVRRVLRVLRVDHLLGS
jgi:anti-anti-sigma factor